MAPVPISYLSGLSDRVRAVTLSLDDQLAVVVRLRTAMERPRERQAALELLQAMRQRTDLCDTPALEIDRWRAGNTAGAEKASKMALIRGIVGIAVGLIVFFAVIGSADSGY